MIKSNLPVILLKGLVLLPNQEARIELTNPISKKVINIAKLYHDDEVLVVCPLDPLEEKPEVSDLPKIGVTGKIKSCIDLPNGSSRIVINGIERVKVYSYVNYSSEEDILESIVSPLSFDTQDEIEETAILRKLMAELDSYITSNNNISNSILSQVKGIVDLNKLTDIITNFVPLNFEKKINLMLDINPISRAKSLIKEMSIEKAIYELENKLDLELRNELDASQKEFILKEKIKVIKDELGEKDSKSEEIEFLYKKINSLNINGKAFERLKSEIERYRLMPDFSPEISVTRNYIDTLLKVPWNKRSKDNSSLNEIEKLLEKSHYGLHDAKTRIVEYIAIRSNSSNAKTPIICLSGPPGVGKTTFAHSISKALNREFVKISLGGVNDTSEIIGHRRTYIGASPGKIINGLIKAGVKNPVFLLDEIDKLTKDFRGDPASALLDVLDPNQNNKFVDNYIEEEVDLSEVLFIVTANDINNIPPALFDRLEIINISGYTDEEKLNIAEDYLIMTASNNNGISSNSIKFHKNAILKIISEYTKENGVRELERLINKIIRKVITEAKKQNLKIKPVEIKESDIINYLGIPKYPKNLINTSVSVGIVNALAASYLGGLVTIVETSVMPGSGIIKTTGSLGDVLKESIEISISYIKSNVKSFKVDAKKLNSLDFHVNFRESALPKDGPSAGTAITTSILSELLNYKVSANISMTGEMTLKGDVLIVGGIKDKLIAAKKNNIKVLYLPYDNKRDVDEIDANIKKGLKIKYIKNYIEIFKDIFNSK